MLNTRHLLQFGATLKVEDSVKRDWGDAVANGLKTLSPLASQLPSDIVEIAFQSVSGDGRTTRSVAYDDLWVSVQKQGEQPQSSFLIDGLETMGQSHTAGMVLDKARRFIQSLTQSMPML
jgi:hypothetical protein